MFEQRAIRRRVSIDRGGVQDFADALRRRRRAREEEPTLHVSAIIVASLALTACILRRRDGGPPVLPASSLKRPATATTWAFSMRTVPNMSNATRQRPNHRGPATPFLSPWTNRRQPSCHKGGRRTPPPKPKSPSGVAISAKCTATRATGPSPVFSSKRMTTAPSRYSTDPP